MAAFSMPRRRKPDEAHRILNDTEHRFDGLLAQFVEFLADFGLQPVRHFLLGVRGRAERGWLRLGQKITIVTDAGHRLEGAITFISPRAEFTPRNVQTAEERSRLVYRIKVSVDNHEGVLKAGMPVEAELPR